MPLYYPWTDRQTDKNIQWTDANNDTFILIGTGTCANRASCLNYIPQYMYHNITHSMTVYVGVSLKSPMVDWSLVLTVRHQQN